MPSSPETTPPASDVLDGTALAGKYLTFRLGAEGYGLPILKVRELIGLLDITRVPGTQPFVRGVVNLRGRVIPVMDLRQKLGMGVTEAVEHTVIIVVQLLDAGTPITVGVMVDEVLEVIDFAPQHIEPPPSVGSRGFDADYLLGVGRSDPRVLFLLDIDRVLSADETAQVARVSS